MAFTSMVSQPQLGDIAAFGSSRGSGHSAIFVGGGVLIYAGQGDVKINTLNGYQNQASKEAVTFRRFKP